MQVDWITIAAQIVNFLILVALLRRFLYRPVLDAMNRREARIADRMREADAREHQADEQRKAFEAKAADIETRRQEILERARDEAEAERRTHLEAARAEVEQQHAQWRAQMQSEWDDAQVRIRQRLAETVTEATKHALADLADADLEAAMARAFCRRLAGLGAAERQAAGDPHGAAEIFTAAEPDDETKEVLATSVREALGRPVTFHRSDDLVGGIELRAGDWKLSWTLAEYVRDLEERLDAAIAGEARQTRAGGAAHAERPAR